MGYENFRVIRVNVFEMKSLNRMGEVTRMERVRNYIIAGIE